MVSKVTVRVIAQDPISSAGVAGILARHPRFTLVSAGWERASVIVVAVETLLLRGMDQLHAARSAGTPVVLLASGLEGASLMTLVECGVVAFLDRRSATEEELTEAVIAAADGHGVMSKHDLGKLFDTVRAAKPAALGTAEAGPGSLSARETDILRLIADGLDTSEVARALSYSESTVKHTLRDLTTRLQLRNRCHAVAFALRAGLI